MNIQEAIRSNRPAKRASWETYFKLRNNMVGACILATEHKAEFLSAEDILAEDWEVLEHKTQRYFNVSVMQAVNAVEAGTSGSIVHYSLIQDKLLKYHNLNQEETDCP